MENTQYASMDTGLVYSEAVAQDIATPLQTLFDECISFIAITDFEQ